MPTSFNLCSVCTFHSRQYEILITTYILLKIGKVIGLKTWIETSICAQCPIKGLYVSTPNNTIKMKNS